MATPMEKARAYLNASKLMMQAATIMQEIEDIESGSEIVKLGNSLAGKGFDEVKKIEKQ